MIRTLFILPLCLTLVGCSAQKQLTEHILKANENYGTKAGINDFSMLVGSWTGEGLGGMCDELWLPAKAEQMQGVFRMIENNELVFTEFMSILKDSTSWVMKIKHFSPDMKGWEAQDESTDFRFIKKENNTLYFDRLTIAATSSNQLNVYVAMKTDDVYKEELFEYKKN